MKKIAAMAVAGALLLSLAPVHAQDAPGEVSTSDKETEQAGEIWATMSSDPLKQLKVTLPIKIEFAVVPNADGNGKEVKYGDYKIRVDKDSEAGVTLESVFVKSVDGGEWKLNNDKAATQALNTADDLKTVAINLAGTQLDYKNNAITGFEVEAAGEKSLELEIVTSGTTIPAGTTTKLEKAFDIVYTISQKN